MVSPQGTAEETESELFARTKPTTLQRRQTEARVSAMFHQEDTWWGGQ